MDIKEELKKRISVIDGSLDKFLPEEDNAQEIIYKAMRYSLFAGGKRLRPILMWATAEIFGGTWESVERFACALEMIHTYSLIHDDLPAMDNDDLRRGLPTNHIKFGEAEAILAGDALLNKAFEIMSECRNTDPAKALRAISVISSASGTEGMIGGQVLDLESENKCISLDELRQIHKLKTGALIRAACKTGAILAGATEDDIKAIDEFALYLGIAFQIQDDILDVIGTEEELGKPIGSDETEGKNTYVSICGIEKASELMNEYTQRAEKALDVFGDKAQLLRMLNKTLNGRRK